MPLGFLQSIGIENKKLANRMFHLCGVVKTGGLPDTI
jgi:hypothetical protein